MRSRVFLLSSYLSMGLLLPSLLVLSPNTPSAAGLPSTSLQQPASNRNAANMGLFSFLTSQTPDRVTPEAFRAERKPGDVVIDVRTSAEYQTGHVKGAKNLDVSSPDFKTQISKLDKNKRYYLYCRSGNRSGQATSIMRQAGFEKAFNIGGISDLTKAGVETVK